MLKNLWLSILLAACATDSIPEATVSSPVTGPYGGPVVIGFGSGTGVNLNWAAINAQLAADRDAEIKCSAMIDPTYGYPYSHVYTSGPGLGFGPLQCTGAGPVTCTRTLKAECYLSLDGG